jgi:hypothetical protein
MGRTACTEPQCLYKGALYLPVETTEPRGAIGTTSDGCYLLNCFYKKCMVSLRVVTFRRMLVSLSVAGVGSQLILIPLFLSFPVTLVEFVFYQWRGETLYVYMREPFI